MYGIIPICKLVSSVELACRPLAKEDYNIYTGSVSRSSFNLFNLIFKLYETCLFFQILEEIGRG